jgi:hypothetical protein
LRQEHTAIEAVYIVSPDHLHAEYTIRAAAVGKHVRRRTGLITPSTMCCALAGL